MAAILVVCTGNICRSPLAEAFLRDALVRRLRENAPAVASAGVIGRPGSPAIPETVRAGAERGIDITAHRVRRLLARDVEAAELVVCMAAEHREAVAAAVPSAAARTFTLKELVRLLESTPASSTDGATAAERLRVRVEDAVRLRRAGRARNEHDEDVVDPLGMPYESFRSVAWELHEWCERLAAALFGRSPERAGATAEER